MKYINEDNSQAVECQKILDQIQALRGSKNALEADSYIGFRHRAKDSLGALSGIVDVHCTCKKDSVTGEATNEIDTCTSLDDDFREDNQNLCPTIAEFQSRYEKYCPACDLFATITGSVQRIAAASFGATSDALIELLVLAFLIYIGYVTLITIASPETQKISKYLTTLLFQGARVAFVTLILLNPTVFYNLTVNPLLESSVDFGVGLMGNTKATIMEQGTLYGDRLDLQNEYISGQTATTLAGAVKTFSNSAVEMPAIGSSLICNSFYGRGITVAFLPRFKMFLTGTILEIFGLGIWLAVGFYMLDCIVQLGIVCAIMPFLIASWAFKLTASYTKTGWNMFMNTFFNFIMMSIVMRTIKGLIENVLSTMMSVNDMTEKINMNQADELEASMVFGGTEMLLLICCCIIAYKLPSQVGTLANKFAGGITNTIGTGAQIGGLAASTGSAIATAAVHKVGGAASSAAGAFAEYSGLKAAMHGMKHDNTESQDSAPPEEDENEQNSSSENEQQDYSDEENQESEEDNSDENTENSENTGDKS